MRMIDADSFKEDLLKLWDYSTVDGVTATTVLKQVISDLDNAPTVEAYTPEQVKELVDLNKKLSEERPQGEWIFNTSFWSCSVCKNSVKTIGYCGDKKFMNEFFKFCPNCGADMRGNTKRKGTPIEGNNESYNCENWIP